MDEEIKTLKDFEIYDGDCEQCSIEYGGVANYKKLDTISIKDLKAEAVQWVKSDKQAMKEMFEESKRIFKICSDKWMKRLNITEEDLKLNSREDKNG